MGRSPVRYFRGSLRLRERDDGACNPFDLRSGIHDGIEVPAPTSFPLYFALGLTLLCAGLVTHALVSWVGGLAVRPRGLHGGPVVRSGQPATGRRLAYQGARFEGVVQGIGWGVE